MENTTLEETVYTNWAFSDHPNEKAKINQKIYRKLVTKVKFPRWNEKLTEKDMQKYTCIDYAGKGYAHENYRVVSNPHNLTNDEIALVCDGGNLCFGYNSSGNIITIHTD